MKQIIEGWYHKPGRHCASTAIRDAMWFWGHEVSEAFCFGLGRGIGAFYMSNPNFSPSRWLMTRGPDLEERYFRALNIPFAWKQSSDADDAWARTKSDIDSGIPVLLQTDLFYLPYYNTKTHFNRHAVLLWGYDEENGVGYLSDTERDGLVDVPLDALSQARNSAFPPGPVKYDWFPIQRLNHIGDLKNVALQALRMNAYELANVPKDFPIKMGLRALDAVVEDLPRWHEARDWSWSARFAYQAIERRGTGGGGFRKMYSEFVEEVENLAPEIKGQGLSKLMHRIAETWSEFATCLKGISEKKEPAGFEEAREIAKKIYNLESEYCSKVLVKIEAKKD